MWEPVQALSDLDGHNGLIIEGLAEDDQTGISVSGAGDVNGDGIDDLLIGANGLDNSNSSTAGGSYLLFGGTDLFAG